MKNSVELCNYLEKLRYGRKISQEEFVFGIVSIRQYKRYRCGQCEIPINNLVAFSEKLDLSLVDLLFDFESIRNKETLTMNNLYNSIANDNLSETAKILNPINPNLIIDDTNKLYYYHSLYTYNWLKRSITTMTFIENTCRLIDYPRILDKKVMSDIEVLVLSSLLEHKNFIDGPKIIEKMIDCINQESYIISGANERIILLVLVRISKYLGVNEQYLRVIKLCLKGVQICISKGFFYLLDYFYYYLALAYYKIDQQNNFVYYLFQCFHVVYLEENNCKIIKFSMLIKRDFDITYDDLIRLYSINDIMLTK